MKMTTSAALVFAFLSMGAAQDVPSPTGSLVDVAPVAGDVAAPSLPDQSVPVAADGSVVPASVEGEGEGDEDEDDEDKPVTLQDHVDILVRDADAFDENGDEVLNLEEFTRFYEALDLIFLGLENPDVSEEELQDLFNEEEEDPVAIEDAFNGADEDSNGVVDFSELSAAYEFSGGDAVGEGEEEEGAEEEADEDEDEEIAEDEAEE